MAGIKTVDCMRVLSKSGHSLVSEVLRNNGDFTQWEHYPPDDVHDPDSHSQYYFHAHAPEETINHDFGHFHTFIMPRGIPEHLRPPQLNGKEYSSDGSCHLIAISMSPEGMPERLFTTNRWVTGETWYAASDVIGLLDRFDMDVAHPSWPLNQWLSAMVVLFRPQIRDPCPTTRRNHCTVEGSVSRSRCIRRSRTGGHVVG